MKEHIISTADKSKHHTKFMKTQLNDSLYRSAIAGQLNTYIDEFGLET